MEAEMPEVPLCTPPGEDQPQGANTRASKSKRFLAEFWVQQELAPLNFRGEEQSLLWVGMKSHLELHFLSLLCCWGALPTVITWRFVCMSLDSKVKCYLYISTEFMTFLQLFLLHITKNVSKLFPTISIPRKPWEHLHEQIQIHECSARLWRVSYLKSEL